MAIDDRMLGGTENDALVEKIAQVCHEANRAWCRAANLPGHASWQAAEEWQKKSAREGVRLHLNCPGVSAGAGHEAWAANLIGEGWKWGAVKDSVKKEHPCLVPFSKLPAEERIKDHIFTNIVAAFRDIREPRGTVADRTF